MYVYVLLSYPTNLVPSIVLPGMCSFLNTLDYSVRWRPDMTDTLSPYLILIPSIPSRSLSCSPCDLFLSILPCEMVFAMVLFTLTICPNHLTFLFITITSGMSYFRICSTLEPWFSVEICLENIFAQQTEWMRMFARFSKSAYVIQCNTVNV